MFLFGTRVIFDLVSESSVYDDLNDEHGQYAFLRSNGRSPIGVSVSYRHRVMRRFSFRRRILLKHTDLTPQWCEVHNPLHGKIHAVYGQTLFRVRLKSVH